MNKSLILMFIFALLCCASVASAVTIIDPDAFPAGTDISNAFPGVTLSTRDGVAPGINARSVTSEFDASATTGTLAFAHDGGNTTWGNGQFEFLRADFVGGATSVSLDFFANDIGGDSNAQLLAFDAADMLLDSDLVAFVPFDDFVTLTVSAPNIAYVAAYWDELVRSQNGGLDNLVYERVPEPSTFLLTSTACILVVSCPRRRRNQSSFA
jgi:hypothetical protein